ncbi:MAG: metallophosphoesterase family protein [Planctomycetes bacterium]|nr:metallophosphoesterase family protein [Planctomycetota bacterium]MBI3847728.1 metallophosphoesterase family protein [Planctomycetota bacterium]
MRTAIISDVHANLEALQSVLEDIAVRGLTDIVCLGDVVGYGPNPRECADLVRTRCRFTIRGNHEDALVAGAEGFNPFARKAIDWTREELRRADGANGDTDARWDFLVSLPVRHSDVPLHFVHGSPRDPVNEYLFGDDVRFWDQKKYSEIFGAFEGMLFVGHTHIPCVITESAEYLLPSELEGTYRVTTEKAIVNVGSVGQPRDRDWRASYAEWNDGEVRFHRVPYDVETTVRKIRSIRALTATFGERLLRGF